MTLGTIPRLPPSALRTDAPGAFITPQLTGSPRLRKLVVAIVTVASALLGLAVPTVAAAESDAKVVIIVGADTPQYLDDANELYAEAIQHTSNVIRVYSPNATWSAVDLRDDRRERRDLPRPRQRLAEPVHVRPEVHDEGRLRPELVRGRHARQPQVLRRAVHQDARARAGRARVPPPPLLRVGQLGARQAASRRLSVARQRVDNYGSAFLAAGASAVIADGHSHTGYYLRALFTEAESLNDLWHGAPNYNGHDIPFTPTPQHGLRDPGPRQRRRIALGLLPLDRREPRVHDPQRDRREAAAGGPRRPWRPGRARADIDRRARARERGQSGPRRPDRSRGSCSAARP